MLASDGFDDRSYPLLLSAVTDYNFCRQMKYHDRPKITHSGPNVDIVELLLEKGANPNASPQVMSHARNLKPRTPWQVVKKRLEKPPANEAAAWERIHELFLSHGASDDAQNLNTQNNKSKDRSAKSENWRDKISWGVIKKSLKRDPSGQEYSLR